MDPKNDAPLLLTIPQAAEMVSLSRSTLYILIKKGEFPVVHIGGAVRVRPDDLKAWVRRLPRNGE